jgi:3-hydroxyisobutyrate dehydrogenase
MEIGWIGIGRMGQPMAARLLRAGTPLRVWNRTRSKAQSLIEFGATIADNKNELRDADVVFTMLLTGKDLEDVCFGEGGLADEGSGPVPKIIVDCSTIGMEESAAIRARLKARGVDYIASPVSGNPNCVIAGKLSCVASGPRPAFETVRPLLETIAVRGVAYAGEGELARICKVALNVMLAVVMENLIEVTLLAQKAGVSRDAFLKFVNNSVLGSIFTQYKSPALVNLDFTTTFTLAGQRKDIDLGLATARQLGVAMPVTAATREVFQAHFGAATRQPDPEAYLAQDFSALLETLALMAGMTLKSEDVDVPSGLEV